MYVNQKLIPDTLMILTQDRYTGTALGAATLLKNFIHLPVTFILSGILFDSYILHSIYVSSNLYCLYNLGHRWSSSYRVSIRVIVGQRKPQLGPDRAVDRVNLLFSPPDDLLSSKSTKSFYVLHSTSTCIYDSDGTV